MYAVVRRYQGATQLFEELARRQADIEQVLRDVPGFVDYYLLRTADGGASVTVCGDQAGTQESTRRGWGRDGGAAARQRWRQPRQDGVGGGELRGQRPARGLAAVGDPPAGRPVPEAPAPRRRLRGQRARPPR
jgi:hypothetical protein